MHIFVALDLEEEIRGRIQHFVDHVRPLAPHARWVSAESLHITLKFIGEKPDALVKQIESTLGSITVAPFRVTFSGTGFFPTPRAARVFWVGIEAEPGLADLAANIEDSLAGFQIPKEQRALSPHLTLARASAGSGAPGWRKGDKPNRQFVGLQEHLANLAAPGFGTMTAREFFLYKSQLSNKGSRYTKIARFSLDG
jgi:RNA 2',3'-cyclic 3'-phosphodiesterase